MKRSARLLPLLVVLLSATVRVARADTIDSITEAGLGYPVPLPVDSLTAVDGFRTLEALAARYDELWLANETIERAVVGTSIRGRDIVAYRLTSEGDLRPGGSRKSAALVIGGMHAREWASPEAVATVYEWLAEEGASDPVAAYLLENTVTVILAVANPDAFLFTQAYPERTICGGSDGWGDSDGRMRRKNLRGVDDDLETLGDHLLGVDLNRNLDVGFGNASASPTGETFHGVAPRSEPETQAVVGAADLARVAGEDRLRFVADVHTFGQLFYVIRNASSERNRVVEAAYQAMRRASATVDGRGFGRICGSTSGNPACDAPVGATDEFFTGTYGAAAYTLEMRPASGELANGFVLPDSQIAVARREVLEGVRAGLYHLAAPPALIEVAVHDHSGADGEGAELVFLESRALDSQSGQRLLVRHVDAPLASGRTYTLVLRFNKPMRLRDPQSGEPTGLPGQPVDDPEVLLLGGEDIPGELPPGRWIFAADDALGYARYPGDTYATDFELPAPAPGTGEVTLSVAALDLVRVPLDADARTVADWSPQGWTGYEDVLGRDSALGGPDTNTRLRIGRGRQVPGDCNQDGALDVTDPLCVLSILFLGVPERFPCGDGESAHPANVALLDWQDDGAIDVSDAIASLSYQFLGGPAHALADGLPPGGCVGIVGCSEVCEEG